MNNKSRTIVEQSLSSFNRNTHSISIFQNFTLTYIFINSMKFKKKDYF